MSNRVYSILFVTDYSKSTARWRSHMDSIRYNLLGREPKDGESWVRVEKLVPITVSTCDLVETKDAAIAALQEKHYDVIIANNKLNEQSVMSGTLKRWRMYHPNAVFIPLLNFKQKKGQVIPSVGGPPQINDGKGVANLYEAGFYNAVWKDCNFHINNIIYLILAGGRPAEQAYKEYGLDIDIEPLKAELMAKYSQKKLESAVPRDESGAGAAIGQKPAVSDVPVQNPVEVEAPTPFPSADIPDGSMAGAVPERVEVVEPVVEIPKVSSSENIAPTVPPVFAQPSPVSYIQPEPVRTVPVEPSVAVPVQGSPVQETSNFGIAAVGALTARVTFAQGNTIILQTDRDLGQQGLTLADVIGMPVSIPFIKRGDIS